MKQTKPLEGVRILDFTRLLPGPAGTMLLAEMGAEITKIESPKRKDDVRYMQPLIDGVSSIFHVLNHNKNQKIIDYESEAGKEEIFELIKNSDVMIEQFRPGVMARFGLSFENAKKINPEIVYISVTGYGQNGELRDKAGHDINYLALSGLLDLNRDENGKPVVPGFQLADVAGGSLMILSACTTGLLAAARTKKAHYIDISLAQSAVSIAAIPHGMTEGGIDYHKAPVLSGMMVNYGVYECKDGKWLALGALETKFWNTFCEMVGEDSWKVKDQMQLIKGMFDQQKLIDLFKVKTRDEWVALSKDFDVCLSPILTTSESTNNQHFIEREVFRKISVGDKKIHAYTAPFNTYSE